MSEEDDMFDKGKKPKRKLTKYRFDKMKPGKRKLTKYRFDKMKPGDSFYYEGSRTKPIISYGSYRTIGEYRTEKEEIFDAKGNLVKSGWRFYLLKKE